MNHQITQALEALKDIECALASPATNAEVRSLTIARKAIAALSSSAPSAAEPQTAWVWNPANTAWAEVRAPGHWQQGALYAFGPMPEPLAPSAADPVAVPTGWMLVPRATTEQMREAFKRAYKEGSFWCERIDRALDEMLLATPPAPQAASEPVSKVRACIACAMRDAAIAQPPSQEVTPAYLEWLKTKSRSAGVGGNEAWNAGVEWARAQAETSTTASVAVLSEAEAAAHMYLVAPADAPVALTNEQCDAIIRPIYGSLGTDQERRLVRAAAAALAFAPVAEPVGEIKDFNALPYEDAGADCVPIIHWRDEVYRHNVGTKLYAGSPPAPEEAKEAARKLKKLADDFADSKAERWCGRGRGATDPGLWERDRAALHSAIDAALSQGDR